MPKIFISYRRADSDAIAGRIRDRLASHYGDNSVYMDVDSIPFGQDFRDHVKEALASNEVLIAVVGPRWTGPGKGGPRIKAEADPVRFEVETALNAGIPVIPVLVGGATMPRPSDLPAELAHFSFRNAAPVDSGRDFHLHMDRLIRSMDAILLERSTADLSEPHSDQPTVPDPALAARLDQLMGVLASEAPHPTEEPAVDTGTADALVPPQPAKKLPAATPFPPVAEAPRKPPGESPPSSPEPPTADAPPASPVPPARPVKPDVVGRRRSRWPIVAALAACAVIGAVVLLLYRTPQLPRQDIGPSQAAAVKPAQQAGDAGPLAACSPDTPAVLRDDFASARPGWDLSQTTRGSTGFYADGQMVVQAAERASLGILYTSQRFKNVTICARVQSPADERTNATTGGGIAFWSRDSHRFYVAGVHPDGSYGVYRFGIGSASVIMPRTRVESVKPGLGVVNEIVVRLNGNSGTLYINGSKVGDFDGEAPDNGGSVGLWGQSQEDQANEWRFLSISVVEN